MQQSYNNYLCSLTMYGKYKHSIAIFFLMAIGIMLAESSLHALLHVSIQHTQAMNAHHSCGHGGEVEKQSLQLTTFESGPSIFEDSYTESCMRCADYMVQEHLQLATTGHKLVMVHDEHHEPAETVAATSCMVAHSFLRGPPEA